MQGSERDADLVRAVQAGSLDAYSELFQRHYPSVQGACARRLRNRFDADEVAQAAFVKGLERIGQCDGERRFGPWVHVIARRLCLDAMRAQARTSSEEAALADRAEPAPATPEDSVLARERVQHLKTALLTLPRRQREAVVARAVEERRPPEIAASLGLSVGAVDSLLLRGRRRLAEAYVRAAAGGSPFTP